MKINYLQEFLVLAGCLNYRAAARKLFLSQSALSRHMDALEAELNTRLFSRTTQVVTLTETGKLLQLRARGFLDEYEDIKRQIADLESRDCSRLRIGVPYYSVEDYLGSIPTQFQQKFPEIKTEYYVDTPTDVFHNLANHKTDMAFLVNYRMDKKKEIEYIPVYRERLGAVMNANNPLAEKDYLLFSDLCNETFLFLTDPFFISSLEQINSLARTLGGFSIEKFINYDRMESLLIGVSKNDGICVSGELLRSQTSRFVTFRPIVGNGCFRMVCLCKNKDNRNPAVDQFIDLYRNSGYYRL